MKNKTRILAVALVMLLTTQMSLLLMPVKALAAYEPTGHNKALGATYSVYVTDPDSENAGYETAYPDRDSYLTDGTWSSLDYADRTWIGWANQGSRVVALALPKRTTVNQIRMRFMQNTDAGIYLPANVTYQTSLDGQEWTTVGADYPWASRSRPDALAEWYRATDVNRDANYVRAIFPVDVWVFGTELEVWGKSVQVVAENGWIEMNGEQIPLEGREVAFYPATVHVERVRVSIDRANLTRLGRAELGSTGPGALGVANLGVQILSLALDAWVRFDVDVLITTYEGGTKSASIVLRDPQKRLSMRQHAGESKFVDGYYNWVEWEADIASLQRFGVDVPSSTWQIMQSYDKGHGTMDVVADFSVSATGELQLHTWTLPGDRLVLYTSDGEKDVSSALKSSIAADAGVLDEVVMKLMTEQGIRLIPPGSN